MNKFLEKLGISKNALLVVLAVIVGGILWYMIMLKGQAGKIDELKNEYVTVEAKIRQAESGTGDITRAMKDINQLKKQINDLTAKVPGRNEMSDIISHLVSRAERNNCKIISIDPATDKLFSKDATTNYYLRIPINIQIHATYMDFGHFLEQFRDLPFYLSVEGITMNYAPDIFPELNIQMQSLVVVAQKSDKMASQ